jgi:hypothetical protein
VQLLASLNDATADDFEGYGQHAGLTFATTDAAGNVLELTAGGADLEVAFGSKGAVRVFLT